MAGRNHLESGLLQAAPDAIIAVGADGAIVLVNAQAERLFGYPRADLVGQPIELLVPEAARGVHPGHREGYAVDPRPREMGAGMELSGRRRDGSEFPVEISLSGVETDEGIVVTAAVRDVTERKQAERQLRDKNLELEKANAAKNNFLASMSHELRTPLNAIIGFTGTLLMQLPGPLNEEQDRQLRTVQRSGKHLLSIINDLLDLAKIESGEVRLTLEPVDCCAVVAGVVTSLEPLATEKSLDLSAVVPPAAVIARSDARALEQILINLVNNAIKFTDTGRVSLCVQAGGDGLAARIEVTDTGRGIAHDDVGRLFRAFERGEYGAGRAQEGTGLGLHISSKLAELINARITVRSTPGSGSTFAVLLGA